MAPRVIMRDNGHLMWWLRKGIIVVFVVMYLCYMVVVIAI